MNRYDKIYKNEKYQFRLNRITVLEKDRVYCRHDLGHFLDVARIMYILSLEENCSIPADIIYAAALLHDIGRLEQYEKGIPHNEASVSFAREILPESGYDENETEDICSAILFHRHSCKSEHSTLGMLLRKADKLSRRCYECTAKNECYWDEYSKNPGLEY